jgi:hypothetical protein
MIGKRKEKVRLLDKTGLAIQHNLARSERPSLYFRSEVHRAHIRLLPCHGCGARPSECAHVRYGSHTPMKETPHDFYCWPGCNTCHQGEQHYRGERTWWAERLVHDPLLFVAKRYGLQSPCPKTRAAAGRWLETGSWLP